MSRIGLMGSTALLAVVVLALPVQAAPPKKQAKEALPEVVVTADRAAPAAAPAGLSTPVGAFTLTGEPLAAAAAVSDDTAAMLTAIPGVQTAAGGGVSSLPVMRGFADDRINVLTMGMAITSACANHMNPALSYVDPSRIGKVEVLAGVTPVSKGGDSIGGTIIVEPRAPRFAGSADVDGLPGYRLGNGVVVHGSASTFWRSNGNVLGGALNASVANADWSLEYDGSGSRGQNYKAGGGTVVRDSLYATQNHAITLARRLDSGLLTFAAGLQDIPYQGFPNVRMDMLYNRSEYMNVRFENAYDWGRLDARAYWQETRHYMNFLADKMATGIDATPTNGMPMYTSGTDSGWSVKGEIPIGKADTLRIGNEFQHTTLDDWWPPVAGMTTTMCCSTFVNVNGARRDRLGTWAELEHVFSKEWSALLGVRNDTVWMDTGNVGGYSAVDVGPNMMGMPARVNYLSDSNAFNARNHARTDVNFDMTALLRWKPLETTDLEFGYARKTRSPNFYERYSWSTGAMASRMISWFGDANGYVGNIDLKPEVAHTLSATMVLHDRAKKAWEVKVTPWFSHVENYIDVDRRTVTGINYGAFPLLQFANHDAELYGFDAAARAEVWTSDVWGRFDVSGRASYTHGRNLDTHDGLYRVMPFEGAVGLDHRLGGWSQHAEVQMVSSKTDVSSTRNELRTAGYALVNWRTGYQWQNVRLELGVDNLLDQKYASPLSGIDYGENKKTGAVGPLAGPGRSIFATAKVSF
jgi:iron complex outermembrane receptor protein